MSSNHYSATIISTFPLPCVHSGSQTEGAGAHRGSSSHGERRKAREQIRNHIMLKPLHAGHIC